MLHAINFLLKFFSINNNNNFFFMNKAIYFCKDSTGEYWEAVSDDNNLDLLAKIRNFFLSDNRKFIPA